MTLYDPIKLHKGTIWPYNAHLLALPIQVDQDVAGLWDSHIPYPHGPTPHNDPITTLYDPI